MDEKPKIIRKLEWLYLVSGGIFFLDAIFALIVLINVALSGLSDPNADQQLAIGCLSIFIFCFLVCLIMGLFSIKIWDLTKKGNKLTIDEGRALSIVSLLIFIGPTIFLLWSFITARILTFSRETLLLILLDVLLFLTVLLNILVIAISLTSQVKTYCKISHDNS